MGGGEKVGVSDGEKIAGKFRGVVGVGKRG